MSVERFELFAGSTHVEHRPDPRGPWVRHSDHAATISQLQAEIARYREALTEIRDGRGKCETCGMVCVGEGGGVTECDCSYPTWTEQDPAEIASAALGGSHD